MYSYMNSFNKFAETALPPLEEFYNDLDDEPCSSEDYAHANLVWSHFQTSNLMEYAKLYLITDVLLLCDVFSQFRKEMLTGKHGLDPAKYITAGSLALHAGLKFNHTQIKLICDPEQYLLFEAGLRGGFTSAMDRYGRSNQPDLPEYNPDEELSALLYLDKSRFLMYFNIFLFIEIVYLK